jgi:hypothetical protein
VIEPELVFRGLKTVLDRPPMAFHRHQRFDGCCRQSVRNGRSDLYLKAAEGYACVSCEKKVSPIPRQLPTCPVRAFPVGVEHALDVRFNARMTPIRANIFGPPSSTTSISAWIAVCHSGSAASFSRAQ